MLTAHQRDDQAETLLLQVLRGAGVHGIAAIPAQATFGSGYLARPLLAYSRSELRAYALSERVGWVEDPSNADPSYRRNFLRLLVMPQLAKQWSEAAVCLARTAAHAADASAVLDEVADADLIAWRRPDGGLGVGPLCVLSGPRLRNLLRRWLRTTFGAAPSTIHLRQVEDLLRVAPRSGHAIVAWPGAEVHRFRDALYARRPAGLGLGNVDVPWDGSDLVLPELGLRVSSIATHAGGVGQRWFDLGAIRVRRRQGGEQCRPVGRGGHRHTVKKLLQERHVPPWRRAALPLIYVSGELAAVADLCVCEPFAAVNGEAGRRIVVQEL